MWICPLCQLPNTQAPKTIEHVVPKWLLSVTNLNGQQVFLRNRPTGAVNVKISLCQKCNGWLNETFEIPCRQLLTAMCSGHHVRLSQSDQTLVSGYISKHVLLFNEWSRFPRDQNLLRQDRVTFRRCALPLSNSTIYISRIDPDNIPNEWNPMPAPVSQAFLPGTSAARHVIGQLAILWFRGIEFEPRNRQPGVSQLFLRRLQNEGFLLKIWPTQLTGVSYPPPQPIRLDVWESLRGLFYHSEDPHSPPLRS